MIRLRRPDRRGVTDRSLQRRPALGLARSSQGAWGYLPGHDFFFMLESDDYDTLVEGLRPIIPSGTATIKPPGDMGATVAKRIAEESRTSTARHVGPWVPATTTARISQPASFTVCDVGVRRTITN